MSCPVCLFCGKGPVDWHHVTGRGAPDVPYLDPGLVVPLCRRHHAREHAVLRAAGAEWPPGPGHLQHRLRRLVIHVGRCADTGRPFVIEAKAVPGLHSLLCEVLDPEEAS